MMKSMDNEVLMCTASKHEVTAPSTQGREEPKGGKQTQMNQVVLCFAQ